MTAVTTAHPPLRPARSVVALVVALVVAVAVPAGAAPPGAATPATARAAAAPPGPSAAHAAGRRGTAQRVVVTFAPGTSAADRAAVLAGGTGSSRMHATGLPALADAGTAAPVVVHATPAQQARLAGDPHVRSVDPDLPIRADGPATRPNALVVNDPAWPEQDGTRRIRANEAWEQTTGAPEVVIAVIDTGVDPTNPDLRGRVLPGYDFVNRDGDARDDNGHGTAAATIAAAASDAYGIAGICWRCRVLPVKVLGADGNGFLSEAAEGISWAVAQGADVVNVSLGATGTMPVLDSALAEAHDAGVLVVASAGNAGTTAPQWPAADPRVMGIAALDALDRRAGYSNHGTWVDAAAPGCNPAGWLGHTVVAFCGTSSAAPLVAGAAALLASGRDVRGDEIRSALRTTAAPLGAGLGSGRIDVLAALRALPVFSDIAGNVHAGNIEVLAAAGITAGCDATRYCPKGRVTRGQIATFLQRALDLPHRPAAFTDVPADHPHAAGVGAVAGAGITTGCGGGRYCPGATLTRAQMATLLQRALALPAGSPRFRDVPPDHAHAAGIWAVAAAGITTGCEPERFCPGAAVTRAQMASFLVRALDL